MTAGRLRVVAGTAGGLRLVAPAGSVTRPTTDRVRESVFAALEVERGGFAGDCVLDLFAGSGALGIEALSRGASRAVFVDRDRNATAAVTANLESTRLAERGRVVRADATALGVPPEAPFDLILLDPPYGMPAADLAALLEQLADASWARPEATAVLERASGPGPTALPPPWRSVWERRFGDTLVVFAKLE